MGNDIYLVASAGNPNYGDELIVASWLRFLVQVRPASNIWLDCPCPRTARVLFEGMHPRLNITDSLWRACADASDQSAAGVWSFVGGAIANTDLTHSGSRFGALVQSDSIHLLGGGYINGVWPDHVGLVAGSLAAAKRNGCQLIASGLGLMPLPENAMQLYAGLSDFNSLSVRDKPSADTLGIDVGLDDVFLGLSQELDGARPSQTESSRAKDVMVCIQSDMVDEDTFLRLRDSLQVVIQAALARGLSVGYVEAIPGSDRRMFDALGGLIPETNLVPFDRLWACGLPVRSGQHWYTTRFHPHMVAAAAGAKGVAIGILDEYYDVKHKSLLDLGTGWTYVSAKTSNETPEPTGNSGFVQTARELSARKRTEALGIYPLPGTG